MSQSAVQTTDENQAPVYHEMQPAFRSQSVPFAPLANNNNSSHSIRSSTSYMSKSYQPNPYQSNAYQPNSTFNQSTYSQAQLPCLPVPPITPIPRLAAKRTQRPSFAVEGPAELSLQSEMSLPTSSLYNPGDSDDELLNQIAAELPSSDLLPEMPFFNSTAINCSDEHVASEPRNEPPKKRKRSQSATVPAAVRRMTLRAGLIQHMKLPTTLNEKIEQDVTDAIDVYESCNMYLPFQDRINLFIALITYLKVTSGLTSSHIKNFTVHEFVNGYMQYINKPDLQEIVLSIEGQQGTYVFFLNLHISFTVIVHKNLKFTI